MFFLSLKIKTIPNPALTHKPASVAPNDNPPFINNSDKTTEDAQFGINPTIVAYKGDTYLLNSKKLIKFSSPIKYTNVANDFVNIHKPQSSQPEPGNAHSNMQEQ